MDKHVATRPPPCWGGVPGRRSLSTSPNQALGNGDREEGFGVNVASRRAGIQSMNKAVPPPDLASMNGAWNAAMGSLEPGGRGTEHGVEAERSGGGAVGKRHLMRLSETPMQLNHVHSTTCTTESVGAGQASDNTSTVAPVQCLVMHTTCALWHQIRRPAVHAAQSSHACSQVMGEDSV